MKTRDILATFNRGRVSRLAMGRSDVSRVALSAAIQTNWMPRTLGSMMLRPGTEYVGECQNGSHLLYDLADNILMIPFVYSNDDSALLEVGTLYGLRIWVDGDTLLERDAVTATVANSSFATDLTSWTDADDAGSTSSWSSGSLSLVGTGYGSARRRQQVSITETNTVHALRIVVSQGTALIRIGTTAGDDDLFRQSVLREGYHSIAFDPDGNSTIHIELSSSLKAITLIDSCAMESSGVVGILSPVKFSTRDRDEVRYHQSGDVVFIAHGDTPLRVERRPNNSWSVVKFKSNDGPLMTENVSNVRLTPAAISGNTTLTSSESYFDAQHIGALFSLTSQGQYVESSLVAENTYTDYIQVTGVDPDGANNNQREFTIDISGTWSGTLTLQRSIGAPGAWVDVTTYTANATTVYADELDNVIAFYRIGFNTGDFTSGTSAVSLEYSTGSITGVARVTGYTSNTVVDVEVLKDFGGADATEVWAEGSWSNLNGQPESVAIWNGRIWFSGQGRNYGSVSDSLTGFDPNYIGDAAPINRTVGSGVIGDINWSLALQRLVVGTDSGEFSVRSSSFDEPVTPSNYNTRASTTKGSANVNAASYDGKGYFVGKDTTSVYEYEFNGQMLDYTAKEMTLLIPEIGDPGIVRIAAQGRPDFRLHCVKSDGTVAILVRDAAEDVLCWVDYVTDGEVENVVVLPGVLEDKVYYQIKRTIDGDDVWYHERWALESECRGGQLSKCADSSVSGTGSITGLDHLEGETVTIWGDGVYQGTDTVASGAVTGSYTTWCVGLPYTATYQSAKLAGQTQLGLSLTQRSRINKIGLMLADTHASGVQYGPDFTTMDDLPQIEDGTDVDADYVWESYDKDMISFPGEWSTDSRVCLKATAPKPCTVLAAVMNVDRQDTD